MASGNPDETYQPEPMRPEYLDREARLKLMDAQGVERAVLFPSAMALSVENYVKNVPAAYANVHSFNQWFDEEWGFNRDGKIFAPALLSLRDLDLAVAETGLRAGAGARIVLAAHRPGQWPLAGRPVLRPDLVPAERGRCHGRLPHHGELVQRDDRAGLGARPVRRGPGTCRPGSGTTSTASGRSRTRCPR